MTLTLLSTLLVGCGVTFGSPAEFQPPVRLKADGKPVRVESPGYAAPAGPTSMATARKTFSSDSSMAERSASTRILAMASSRRASG